jgi:hypothetical protein
MVQWEPGSRGVGYAIDVISVTHSPIVTHPQSPSHPHRGGPPAAQTPLHIIPCYQIGENQQYGTLHMHVFCSGAVEWSQRELE